jgi:uncharacterized protein (DUF2236 family)
MERPQNPTADSLVTRDDLEALLGGVEEKIADPRAGIFGPESVSWKINRESAVFLGAGRAALLQLAHPWVAVALEQHSSLMSDPIARFHGTFRIVFTIIFGTRNQAFRAARWLYDLHTHIGGQLPDPVAGYTRGSRYEANFVPALRWVYATLVDSAVKAYEFTLPPLSEAEREQYYAESRVLAGLFGIPIAELPENWTDFGTYIAGMVESDAIGVDERSRKMAQRLLSGAGSWVKPPHWYRALTTAWLPERLRTEFELPFGQDEHNAVATAQMRVPRLYRALHASARFSGPYQEGQARLAGRSPGIATRVSNRFWMGVQKMPFGD